MKFKLDENIGERGAELLRAAGHDVMTILQQNLVGITDESLFSIVGAEKRALITLDHDFGHVLRFPPNAFSGIVILEQYCEILSRDKVTENPALLHRHRLS